jgi:hypothetical protein
MRWVSVKSQRVKRVKASDPFYPLTQRTSEVGVPKLVEAIHAVLVGPRGSRIRYISESTCPGHPFDPVTSGGFGPNAPANLFASASVAPLSNDHWGELPVIDLIVHLFDHQSFTSFTLRGPSQVTASHSESQMQLVQTRDPHLNQLNLNLGIQTNTSASEGLKCHSEYSISLG